MEKLALHICLKLVQALQLAIQFLCVDKAKGVCLDGDLMDVIADGGELPHRIIETVVGFFLWLIMWRGASQMKSSL